MARSFHTAKRWITKRVIPDFTNQLDMFSQAPLETPAPVRDCSHANFRADRDLLSSLRLESGSRCPQKTVSQPRQYNQLPQTLTGTAKRLANPMNDQIPALKKQYHPLRDVTTGVILSPDACSTSSPSKNPPATSA